LHFSGYCSPAAGERRQARVAGVAEVGKQRERRLESRSVGRGGVVVRRDHEGRPPAGLGDEVADELVVLVGLEGPRDTDAP